MEIKILTAVQFELNVPTAVRFLEFMLFDLGLQECDEILDFCVFLLHLLLLEQNMQVYLPS